MLSLSLTFPGGRYHATPWDRHVNEGAVAWPPEPWRVARALVATWHHKIKHSGEHDAQTLAGLIESLAEGLPGYRLPAASESHTRHYMPQAKAGETSLIFDAFASIPKDDPLFMTWPDLDLPPAQMALLDALIAVMGYLGRAESWVEIRRAGEAPECDCVAGNQWMDPETGELHGQVITLLAPLPSGEYMSLREHFLADKRAARQLGSTLPDNLLDALSVETSDLRKLGWSQPPAARSVQYLRPIDAVRPRRTIRVGKLPGFTSICYLLVGKPLPRVEDSVRIGELLRQAVMSQAKQLLGEDAVPAMLSGHGLPVENRHRHAFYLPFDANRDGYIDRLLLHVPGGLGLTERRVVERVRRIWSRDGGEWRLALESLGDAGTAGSLLDAASTWISTTPYLHPWHVKKNFSIEDQIRRECAERNLPHPVSMERLERVHVGTQMRRPIHFHRFRSKRGLSQPDRNGSFWRLEFAEPVSGPVALGFGCHFGLGLFTPDR